MQPTRHPKDDAAHELRAREIRDVLRTLDPAELEARVRAAAESGDDELLQALQKKNPAHGGVFPDHAKANLEGQPGSKVPGHPIKSERAGL